MARSLLPFDVDKYTVPQRIMILAAIWDSILDEEPSIMPLTHEQIARADRLLKQHGATPEECARWEAVKTRAFRRTG
jgi:putative addiction module component (TIGR02574 family)